MQTTTDERETVTTGAVVEELIKLAPMPAPARRASIQSVERMTAQELKLFMYLHAHEPELLAAAESAYLALCFASPIL